MTNNPENMPELKPCPFCGCEAEVKIGCFGEHQVRCANEACDAGLGMCCWQNNTTLAIKAWNTRANDTLAEENKRLRDALKQAENYFIGAGKHGDSYTCSLIQKALNQTKGS